MDKRSSYNDAHTQVGLPSLNESVLVAAHETYQQCMRVAHHGAGTTSSVKELVVGTKCVSSQSAGKLSDAGQQLMQRWKIN